MYVNKDEITKKVNETERSMGFISLPKKDKKFFPNLKRKIEIVSSSSQERSLCTYDPKYNRIYGLRSLFLKHSDMNFCRINFLKQNTYSITFKK